MNSKQSGRRQFLKDGAALAGLAIGAVRSVSGQTLESQTPEDHPQDFHAYGKRSRFETSARDWDPDPVTVMAPGQTNTVTVTPLQDSVGIITPSSLHYVVRGMNPPDIDPRQHRLMIHGLVDRPLVFTLEELKCLPSVSRIHFIECAGNSRAAVRREAKGNAETVQQMHGRVSCSEWTGVLLSLLLQEAGVQETASWLVAEGGDAVKYAVSIPLEKAREDLLVAYAQNGEAVRPENGYPLRLVVPGWEGQRNVKWVRRIKVVNQPYMAKGESTMLPVLRPDGKARWFQFEMGLKSVITRPSGGQRLPGRGFYEITGLAWSAAGVIRRVEVSTDGGRTWQDAELQEPVHRIAWTRFRSGWNWNGEEAVLQSRCTDERGNVQPTLAEVSKIWGVDLDYWQSASHRHLHFNPIQPWKVTGEGSVENALF